MGKMRLLILSNMYPSEESFAGIFVKNQYEKLNGLTQKKDYDIDILYMKRKFTNFFGSVLKYLIFFIRSQKIFFQKYDVIHLHYFFPLGILPYLYKRMHPNCKVVITFHGSDVYRFMSHKFINIVFKRFAEDADVLISVGKDLGEEIEDKLNIKPDYILSAGVDEDVFFYEPEQNKKYDFLFVGSFKKRKGVDLICEAIKKRGDFNTSYCFVGGGPLEDDIQRLKSNGYNIQIQNNKTQNELRKIYNQAKWFLFPSRNEPFGLVVTEAIYCGTPVLTSKIGGIKEQVKENGNGFFLECIDTDSITKIIDKASSIREKEYSKMVQYCINSNSKYSLSKVCNNLLDIYED